MAVLFGADISHVTASTMTRIDEGQALEAPLTAPLALAALYQQPIRVYVAAITAREGAPWTPQPLARAP